MESSAMTRPALRGNAVLPACAASLLVLASVGRADAADCALEPQGEGRVAAVLDSRSFRLEDGREIRLAGIERGGTDRASGRTAVGISAPSAEHEGAAFEQKRVGLHHLCFRARERADVDELHGFLTTLGAKIIRAPREDQWAPGYYSILFEDPDGIRLELNHVPGKGLLG